jgi:PiT family inorganic phosphate transporter
MIVGAPVIGLLSAFLLMILVYRAFRSFSPSKLDFYFRRVQLLSAGASSLSHGANDAQETMAIITGVLVTSGYQTTFQVHTCVILAAHAAIALGT